MRKFIVIMFKPLKKRYPFLFNKVPNVILVILLLLIVIPVTSFLTFYAMYRANLRSGYYEKIRASGIKCPLYGEQPSDKYYTKYIVKSGDSLISIARDQLGDSSRVYELISYNKDKYPLLNSDRSLIEEGWIFSFPNKDLGPIKGRVVVSAGMFIDKLGQQVQVTYNEKGTSIGGFPLTSATQIIGKQNLEFGDCILVVSDYTETSYSIRIVRIEYQ